MHLRRYKFIWSKTQDRRMDVAVSLFVSLSVLTSLTPLQENKPLYKILSGKYSYSYDAINFRLYPKEVKN